VNANRTQSIERPSGSDARVSSDHISELMSTFRQLREQGRSVMARLRESMYEMQAHRARLRRDRDAQPPVGATPPSAVAVSNLQQHYGMTPREVEVALLLAEGCSNSTVAQRLGISPHTARHHTQRVLVKLGVRSRAEAGARLRR
jgi:DNA-binding CsgD family transcriptional regulator